MSPPTLSSHWSGRRGTRESFDFNTTLHYSCRHCHHWHNAIVVNLHISRDRSHENRIKCSNCGQEGLAIGGIKPRFSLMSQLTTISGLSLRNDTLEALGRNVPASRNILSTVRSFLGSASATSNRSRSIHNSSIRTDVYSSTGAQGDASESLDIQTQMSGALGPSQSSSRDHLPSNAPMIPAPMVCTSEVPTPVVTVPETPEPMGAATDSKIRVTSNAESPPLQKRSRASRLLTRIQRKEKKMVEKIAKRVDLFWEATRTRILRLPHDPDMPPPHQEDQRSAPLASIVDEAPVASSRSPDTPPLKDAELCDDCKKFWAEERRVKTQANRSLVSAKFDQLSCEMMNSGNLPESSNIGIQQDEASRQSAVLGREAQDVPEHVAVPNQEASAGVTPIRSPVAFHGIGRWSESDLDNERGGSLSISQSSHASTRSDGSNADVPGMDHELSGDSSVTDV